MIKRTTLFFVCLLAVSRGTVRTKEGTKLIITIVGTKANFSEKLLEPNKKEYRKERRSLENKVRKIFVLVTQGIQRNVRQDPNV